MSLIKQKLIHCGHIFYSIGILHLDNDSAIYYFNEALPYEVRLNNTLQIANINYAIGLKKFKQNQLDSAIYYWEIAANKYSDSYIDDNT